jgi:rfaE bifunctional protein kinase chain/domain
MVNMRRNDKIKTLEELVEVIASIHTQNDDKKIAHTHGVFDVLHIGHIRHFEQAKELGDFLVVTVTPDRYVKKELHRSMYSEDLRAEAIAALDSVDYVAINKWPVAAETIQLLQPDFYIKSSEDGEALINYSMEKKQEEVAIKNVGGQFISMDDITFSSSSLINRSMSAFPKEVSDFLDDFSTRYRAEDILEYLESSHKLKVLVVGDTIIDEYQYCQAIGKSSKEPMLAVKYLSDEKFAGGILAVANHVANFCDQVGLVTFLGTENSQEEFIREKLNSKIEKIFLHRRNSPTVVKRRFVERYFFTKLLEVYEINDGGLDAGDNELLCDELNDQLPKYDVVLVVDFGHGMLSREAIDILCDKARFLAVNAQSNAGNLGYHTISKYSRADYVSIAENEIRIEARDQLGDLNEMVLDVSRKLACERIAVTRGKYGCLCYSEDKGFFDVPAFASKVVDRMGAGDAFLSLTALCVAQDIPMEAAGFIGNAVGAQAVGTIGHRTSVERVPLYKFIESLLI